MNDQEHIEEEPTDGELRIHKLRKGSFFPVILEPRRRIDQALYAVVMEADRNPLRLRLRIGAQKRSAPRTVAGFRHNAELAEARRFQDVTSGRKVK